MNLIKLKKLANAGKFEDVQTLWPDAVSDPERSVEDLIRVVSQVHNLGAAGDAEGMLSVLLDAVGAQGGDQARLDVVRAVADGIAESDFLARELRRLYAAVHSDRDDLPRLLETVFDGAKDLAAAVDLSDRYIKLPVGGFLSHREMLDPGMVEAVDAETARLTVTFCGRGMILDRDDVARAILLPPDHFPSLKLYRAEEMSRLAAEDPEAFLAIVLGSSRNRTCAYRDLKKSVIELLGEKAWTGWWRQARTALKQSSRIALSGASQPTFRLLAEERSYDDRLRDRFLHLKDPLAKLVFILDYVDETRKERPADPRLLAEMGNAAAKMAGPLLKEDPELTLVCLAVHAEVAARGADVATLNPRAAAQVLARIENPGALPRRFNDRLLRSLLEFVRSVRPGEWSGFWSRVLPRAGRQTSEMLARELVAAGKIDILTDALREVIRHPTASPDVLFWLWRARLTDTKMARSLAGMEGVSGLDCIAALLHLIDASGRMAAMSDDKKLRLRIDQAHEALDQQEGRIVKEILSGTTTDQAQDFKAMIDGSGGLRPSARASLRTYLRLVHPELFIEVIRAWEEDAIYSTKDALERRQRELNGIVTEDIPAVARQIGEAASHGDLSENSEYTAALEKRDQLTSRATRIEKELQIAKVIDASLSESDYVNVGTRVTVRDLVADIEEIYTFLGIWDSDPEAGILSYKAPLSQSFMGRKVGDTVEYELDGEHYRKWKILNIEPGI